MIPPERFGGIFYGEACDLADCGGGMHELEEGIDFEGFGDIRCGILLAFEDFEASKMLE